MSVAARGGEIVPLLIWAGRPNGIPNCRKIANKVEAIKLGLEVHPLGTRGVIHNKKRVVRGVRRTEILAGVERLVPMNAHWDGARRQCLGGDDLEKREIGRINLVVRRPMEISCNIETLLCREDHVKALDEGEALGMKRREIADHLRLGIKTWQHFLDHQKRKLFKPSFRDGAELGSGRVRGRQAVNVVGRDIELHGGMRRRKAA